jgi:hypothetical protein
MPGQYFKRAITAFFSSFTNKAKTRRYGAAVPKLSMAPSSKYKKYFVHQTLYITLKNKLNSIYSV